MSHPRTEETRLDEGESASGRGGFWFLVFVLVWWVFACFGSLVFFSPSSFRVSFPFNDDLGTPPTRRPHSWKKTGRCTKRSLIGSICSPCVMPRTKDMITVCMKVSASTSFSLDSSCLAGSALAALACLSLSSLLKAQHPETKARRPYCQN